MLLRPHPPEEIPRVREVLMAEALVLPVGISGDAPRRLAERGASDGTPEAVEFVGGEPPVLVESGRSIAQVGVDRGERPVDGESALVDSIR